MHIFLFLYVVVHDQLSRRESNGTYMERAAEVNVVPKLSILYLARNSEQWPLSIYRIF